MPNLLVQNLLKEPNPHPPFEMEGNTVVVSGIDSVPIDLHFKGVSCEGSVGVDIVFLVDQSGSMDRSDPDRKRFSAIRTLINEFAPSRDSLDRVTLVTFSGDTAVIEQDWKTWSETDATVDRLMNSSPHDLTPMEAGMRSTNQLLSGMNGFYKIAILLSDGFPEPDDEDYPQSQIIRDVRVPEACESRIIYSTIYLHTLGMPDENALLWYIAKQTDYITDYSIGDAPRYSFKIENTDAIVSVYRELFVSVFSRIVPQYVFLQERVSPKLIIDPEAPISFSGDGVVVSQNVIGDVTLDEAIERFRSENLFTILLNELDGEVSLKFSVKINRQALSQADLEAGFVTVPVDVLNDSQSASFIRYLQPTGVTGSAIQTLPMPQATIKFILDLQVRKHVSDDGQLAEVRFGNMPSRCLIWDGSNGFSSSSRFIVASFGFG
jgi:hypothetical protein